MNPLHCELPSLHDGGARDTLVDTPARWECTLYLRGSSTTIIDNAPYAAELVSLAPRRTQRFSPAPGATVYWALRVPAYGQIVQHGQTMVDPDGAAYVTNLLISREDIAKGRIYLSTTLCLADFNGDASVDLFDYLDFVMALAATAPESDFNTDGVIDLFDYLDFLQAFSQGCQ